MRRGCLEEGTVVAFLEGRLSGDDRSVVEGHLDICKPCSELMTWAAADDVARSRAPEPCPFIGQLAPGSRIDRYQILGAVGRGGMGEVYAAYHPDLDRRIALKVVHEAGDAAADRRTRLLREARAIARLSHPNVVTVHDAGAVDDRVYIAMEFVDGDTIHGWLRARPRSWREIVDVFVAAGRGLAAAHAAGVIHRDFKPENVMIGRDGSVRVMDFGLARLEDEPATYEPGLEVRRARSHPAVTTAGAAVGTPAYMAPEQFRREPLDGRADQFSFCVALHEALYGRRPAGTASPDGAASTRAERDGGKSSQAANVPSWLRAIIARGLAEQRARRFPSMDALIRALAKGRARPRRRTIAVAVGLAVALLGFGSWRAARGNGVTCEVPAARLAAVWSGHDDARRQAIHRAFTATGRPTEDASWQRISKLLDDYIGQWSAMYVQICEATHLRGEQSAEVLDLRMSCLSDNLDQVQAVTSVLGTTAESPAMRQAATAVQSITPVARCADVNLLRSAVPMPRDEQTFRAVQQLQRTLKQIHALIEIGSFEKAYELADALRPNVAALGYKPLLAQWLEALGNAETLGMDPVHAEAALLEAVFVAEAARDDATAARAAAGLIFVVGYRLGKKPEADLWMRWTDAILDRIGPGSEQTRSWAQNNYAAALDRAGDFARASDLLTQSIALKERVLGPTHPDVAISLANLAYLQNESGHAADALASGRRALDIFESSGEAEGQQLANTYNAVGDAFLNLGKYADARQAYEQSLRIGRQVLGRDHFEIAYPLLGLGRVQHAIGDPVGAAPILDEALRIRERSEQDPVLVANTRFALARALWDAGRDRRRALALASHAKDTFVALGRAEPGKTVSGWLAVRQRRTPRRVNPAD